MATLSQLELAERYINSTNVSIFLTGKAGTGKTTFLRHIVSTTSKRAVVLAPTGVAAVNAGGVTIHSFFQLPLCPYLPDVKELVTEYQMPDKYKSLRKQKIKVLRTLDLIIIDEISMVRADLLDAVDMTLRRYRRNSRPFGGVQLLMIGDVQQLPPVVKDSEKTFMERVYPSPFFFHSKALKQTRYLTIELKHIFRQQDQTFINLLNNIRDNKADADTITLLNSRYVPNFNPADDEGYIRLTTHNWQANEVNHVKLAALTSKPFTLNATVSGTFPETSYPTDVSLTLKKGAQVMFIKNDSGGHQYYNGKLATVEGFDPDEGVAVVDREGNHIVVNKELWENVSYDIDEKDNQIKPKVEGTFEQYPLRLAWAITVHKSQGLTFDKVVIDAASAFTYGQVYVALSRCRTLEGLVLAAPISDKCLFDNEDVQLFSKSFPTEEQVSCELGECEFAYYFEQLNELFDFTAVSMAFDRVNAIFIQHLNRMFPVQTQRMTDLAKGQMVDIMSVSSKFRNQLLRIRMSGLRDTSDPYLSERVAKGASYFDGQMSQLMLSLVSLLEIEIGNKVVAADFDERSAELRDAIMVKQKCLKSVVGKGFTVAAYNQAKVDFLLDKERSAAPKKASYRSKKAKKKEPTWRETARLFAEGKGIDDIARTRGLARSTICTHLEKAVEAGEIEAGNLLRQDELDEIVKYIVENKPTSLGEIHDHFGEKYDYYQLRVASFFAKDLI